MDLKQIMEAKNKVLTAKDLEGCWFGIGNGGHSMVKDAVGAAFPEHVPPVEVGKLNSEIPFLAIRVSSWENLPADYPVDVTQYGDRRKQTSEQEDYYFFYKKKADVATVCKLHLSEAESAAMADAARLLFGDEWYAIVSEVGICQHDTPDSFFLSPGSVFMPVFPVSQKPWETPRAMSFEMNFSFE
jgi:hypothetical protein